MEKYFDENYKYNYIHSKIVKEHITSKKHCKDNETLCPYCKSTDIDITGIFEIKNGIIKQPIKCNKCGNDGLISMV